jgi:Ubiquitin family
MFNFEVDGKSDSESVTDAVPLMSDVENRVGTTSASSNGSSFMVKVKSSDGSGEVELPVNIEDTVADLKAKLILKLNISSDKRVRLIASGKLLDPDEKKLVADFKISSGSFIHCVISNPPAAPVRQSSSGTTPGNDTNDMNDEIFGNDIAMAMNRSSMRMDIGWRATPVGGLIDSDHSLGSNRDFLWGG